MSDVDLRGAETNCDRCIYWNENPSSLWREDGDCRRHSPLGIRRDETGRDRGEWPRTASDDWCGDWRPRFVPTFEEKP